MKKDYEPLFHVVKRANIGVGKSAFIRIAAILLGLIVGTLLLLILCGTNPFVVVGQLFAGCFGTWRRFWTLARQTAILLLVGLALIPAFKMKFWNLGGNGQILMAALTTACCMYFMGKAGIADWIIWIVMIPSAVLTGVVWAVLPAVFKAFFDTNESLFTLMLNYVAEGIVAVFLSGIFKSNTGSIGIIQWGQLSTIGPATFVGCNDLLSIIVTLVFLALITVYLRYTKHGYELEVVGESQNTARYIGINTKRVIIRTMMISGAVCGVVGLLLAGSISHTVSTNIHDNMGFTAIMVAWLAKFNPLLMILTAFIITFFSRGMAQVQKFYSLTNDAVSDIVLGIIYFFIIGCEFFLSYRLVFKDCAFTRFCAKIYNPIEKFFSRIGLKVTAFFTSLGEKIKSVFKKPAKEGK